MRDLISDNLFSSIEDLVRKSVSELLDSKIPISLISEPNFVGSLSIAPIEASLIDSKSAYRRRIRKRAKNYPNNSIVIENNGEGKGVVWDSENKILIIGEVMSPALPGHLGDDKFGPLTTVAISHSIAQIISPSGIYVRRLRPWALSGNWIHSCMDMTYDPVYTTLKEILTLEGSIRVIPLPEVPSPDVSTLDFIDQGALVAVSSRWSSMGDEGRARSISHLCRSVLNSNSPSTSRLEEIVWNCILAPGWDSDLASQIRMSSNIWRDKDPVLASCQIIDTLLREGKL